MNRESTILAKMVGAGKWGLIAAGVYFCTVPGFIKSAFHWMMPGFTKLMPEIWLCWGMVFYLRETICRFNGAFLVCFACNWILDGRFTAYLGLFTGI